MLQAAVSSNTVRHWTGSRMRAVQRAAVKCKSNFDHTCRARGQSTQHRDYLLHRLRLHNNLLQAVAGTQVYYICGCAGQVSTCLAIKTLT
jgi:hypothetical protein